MPDGTVLIDDIATQRVHTCTLCGGPVEQCAVDSWSNGTILAAVVLCPRCRRHDPQGVAVCVLLEARYPRATRPEGR
jgi:hypothetical protein